MSKILFVIVFGSATWIAPDYFWHLKFIVWNIGQGQWTTLISERYCDHFDIGGEFNLSRKVAANCGARSHRIHLSHWDWDHMSELRSLRRLETDICLWNTPKGEGSFRKKELLKNLPACPNQDRPFEVIYKGLDQAKASSNDMSEVILLSGELKILIPGDSTIKAEKEWASVQDIQQAKGLILGHHGSRTSTSDALLENLKNLRWAISTARKKRFGHPHAEVLVRLQKKKIPILKTEDWGSIQFDL